MREGSVFSKKTAGSLSYYFMGLSEVLISYELIEYNEESSDDIEDSDKNDDTIEEDTLMHIYFNQ